jgi:hypothetical protein
LLTLFFSDSGREFDNKICRELFSKYQIVFRLKIGKNKANFSERGIWLLKRRLFQFLRSNLTHHWTEAIKTIAKGLNSIPLKKLGYLKPSDIINEASSVLVDNALKAHHLTVPTDITLNEQRKNQEQYEAKRSKDTLQKGMYVMLSYKESPFDKSFDLSVRKISKS